MIKDGTGSIEDLFQNMSAGRFYTYLSASSIEGMEKIFSNIKFPFHVVSAYAVGNKHYALVQFTREIKKKTKE